MHQHCRVMESGISIVVWKRGEVRIPAYINGVGFKPLKPLNAPVVLPSAALLPLAILLP